MEHSSGFKLHLPLSDSGQYIHIYNACAGGRGGGVDKCYYVITSNRYPSSHQSPSTAARLTSRVLYLTLKHRLTSARGHPDKNISDVYIWRFLHLRLTACRQAAPVKHSWIAQPGMSPNRCFNLSSVLSSVTCVCTSQHGGLVRYIHSR